MAVTATPVFVQTPKITPQSFVNADGTTKKTVFTAGANGSKITSLMATSTDTSNRVIQLWLNRSAVNYLIGAVTVQALAGSDGAVPTANLLASLMLPGAPKDNDGQVHLFLESGDTLQAGVTVAVTAAKEIDLLVMGANF